MDTVTLLLQGFEVALQPVNLMWALAGSMLGTAIGILPGIGPALTIALLLPVTVSVGPVSAFIMFAGVLYGRCTAAPPRPSSSIRRAKRAP